MSLTYEGLIMTVHTRFCRPQVKLINLFDISLVDIAYMLNMCPT